MNPSIIQPERHFTPCASLAAIGVKLPQVDLFGPIRQTVRIAQKTVKHTPSDQVYDAFSSLLAGAHGLVAINTRLRSDSALQAAFGRSRGAEQSVVQQALDACPPEHVSQMQQALDSIYREPSHGYHHDYLADWQLLDVDRSGLPCGPKAAFGSPGYLARAAQSAGTPSGPRAGQAVGRSRR